MDTHDREVCYDIFRSKDVRYDGRIFVGVLSTGIYCRPVCRARLPKPENCLYFRTAAEAEKAGFRPCLLCRPELAPGSSPVDASSELARKAAHFLRDNCGSGLTLAELSRELGYSERHLRRVFEEEYHVAPVEYLQTCRLLLAKQLLTDTTLSVLDISMAAGFGSVRRMNELFQLHYSLTPTALRRRAADGDLHGDTVSVFLGWRAPYDWDSMLRFLAPRALPGIERVQEGAYARTVRIWDRNGKPCCGTIRVLPEKKKEALRVTLSDSLVPVLPQVLGRVRQMFDLDCDPEVIAAKLSSLETVLPGGYDPGTRVPGCFEPFEMACRAIIGQQITVRAATTLSGRMVEACGSLILREGKGSAVFSRGRRRLPPWGAPSRKSWEASESLRAVRPPYRSLLPHWRTEASGWIAWQTRKSRWRACSRYGASAAGRRNTLPCGLWDGRMRSLKLMPESGAFCPITPTVSGCASQSRGSLGEAMRPWQFGTDT